MAEMIANLVLQGLVRAAVNYVTSDWQLLGKNIEAIDAQLSDISTSVDQLKGMVDNVDGVVTRLYTNLVSEEIYKRKEAVLAQLSTQAPSVKLKIVNVVLQLQHIIKVRTTCLARSHSRMTHLHGLSLQNP
jgi:hypothetical protein